MKVIYTYQQAIESLTKHLQSQTGEDFVIVELIPNTDWASQIRECLQRANCLDSFGNVRADMKIAAIKALRQFTHDNQKEAGFYPMGLAESKYAVENLDKFLKFIKGNARLPREGSYNSDGLK